ncbi:MAG: acetyltransferase [Hyphomicrobiales bacterium]|nr:acetyltransferase [Hyphomicrobiales bacterium]
MSGPPANTYDFTPVVDGDLPRIADWLARPHVGRWWRDPERQLARIRAGLNADWLESFLIRIGGRAVGYIHTHDPNAEPGSPWTDQPAGTRGVDLFIGEEDCIGKGHGKKLVARYVDDLLARAYVSRVIADIDLDNHGSRRVFACAGFIEKGEVDLPWGRSIYVVREGSSSS